jgi:hypothetical protein
MQALGLKPVAFAYPTGHASRRSTRRGPRGRIPERQIFRASSRSDPYIVPGDGASRTTGTRCPLLVMMGRDSDPRDHAVNDTEELRPFSTRRHCARCLAHHDLPRYRQAPRVRRLHAGRLHLRPPRHRGARSLGGLAERRHAVRARAGGARLEHAWRREHGLPCCGSRSRTACLTAGSTSRSPSSCAAPGVARGRFVECADPDGVVVAAQPGVRAAHAAPRDPAGWPHLHGGRGRVSGRASAGDAKD